MSKTVFHHIKYFEIDGYDEIILIDEREHLRMPRRHIPYKILQRASLRTRSTLRNIPKSEFQEAFCLLRDYKRFRYEYEKITKKLSHRRFPRSYSEYLNTILNE